MLGIGAEELILVLIIALFVLGPERMPKMARDIGRVVGDLRRTSDELREEFLNADKLLDKAADAASPPPPVPAPVQTNAAAAPVDGETAFDREMREAKERLKAQRDA
jgi:sec-independent protein translocase protein TatB